MDPTDDAVRQVLAATTLEPVVRWALARDLLLRVVPMDEFTHDVVVPVVPGLVLVFDTT